MKKRVADQLVDMLTDAGIRRIYAVTGDSLNEVNDAIRRNGRMQWVHVRHEEAGAYAAAAEAELNGIACCAGSSGPGHVHLVNGLYDAHRSNSSVLAIASTCPSYEYGTSYFQETNTIKLFEDCSGYNRVATTPAQFPRMLQGALQHAIHKKEVAVIGLPGDLTAREAQECLTGMRVLPSKSEYRPKDTEIQAFADLINASEKITVYCGIGARDAHKSLIELASLVKSPIAYTFRAKMAIQYDNPYEIGMTGLLGLPSAYNSMHESDLLILLGTDFPYQGFLPHKNVKIVQVDSRPERIGRRARVDMALAGHVDDTLKAVLPLVNKKDDHSFLNKQLKEYDKVKTRLEAYVKDRGKVNAISPEYVADTVDSLANEDAIFTVDTGMCCVWGSRYLTATGNREMLGSFNHGSMANAMPMAIGASFARPFRQVVALCGDGGLSMLLGDLATISQYKLPIKLIVFDNRSLGMVKLEMEVAGLPDYQTDMHNPDFAAVAEAMGIKGFNVKDPKDVEPVLQQVFATDGPVLACIKTDPNALAMPPKVEFAQMKGFASSMTRLIMNGRFNEVIDTAKSNMKHLGDIF